MNFEFPDQSQYIELHEVSSIDELRQIINAFKNFFENQGVMFYYEIRAWRNTLHNNIQKIGAYCKYCSAKLIYSKEPGKMTFTLESQQTQHLNHPEVDSQRPINKSSQKKQPYKKSYKHADLVTGKFTDNLYKEYIIGWLMDYEKVLKKHLAKCINTREKIGCIDLHIIRKSMNFKSEVIDEQAEKVLFCRSDLWNQLLTQVLEKEGFQIVPFLNNSHIDSFQNCILTSKIFCAQNNIHETIYLIRRQLEIDYQPNQTQPTQSRQINCLMAFSYVQDVKIELLWFAFVELDNSENIQHHPKDLFNILEALLQVQAIKTFHNCTVFIQDDEKLMIAFTLLKEILQRENSSFEQSVCIHPFITDKLINNEPKISNQQKEVLKQVIRSHKQIQANAKLKILQKEKNCKEIVEKFRARKKFTWFSCQKQNPYNGLEFLYKEFYIKNNLKNTFMEISSLVQIKRSITLHELPIIILNIFMSIKKSLSENEECNGKSEMYKNEKVNFSLAAKPSTNQIQNFEKIYHRPLHKLVQTVSSFPRAIIQILYFYISLSFWCSLKHISIKELENGSEVSVKEGKLSENEFKVKLDAMEFRNLQGENKLWKCDCSIYDLYGVPCQHEILCVIHYQTSFLREINPKWKQRFDSYHPHMVTDFLKKLMF